MAFIYSLRANFGSGESLDSLGRVYGDVTEYYHVTGLNNPDPNAVWPEIYAAPLDTTSDDSVSGGSLKLDHPHPYLDGSDDPNYMAVGGKRPLAQVKAHTIVRHLNYREVIVAVQYRTLYISTSFGGAGESTIGIAKFKQETNEVTPTFRLITQAGTSTWDRGSIERNRTVSYYTDTYVSDEFPDAYALSEDENMLAEPPFIQPDGGGPARKLLYIGANIRKDGSNWVVTELFKDTAPLKQIDATVIGPGGLLVPAVPRLGQLDWYFPAGGPPVYKVFTPEDLYEEIGP